MLLQIPVQCKKRVRVFAWFIQLFLERLSEKVHATITKGIVGGFKFAFLQRNLKEWPERAWIYVCGC